MRCEEIMKRDVECVGPEDTAQAAARRMRDENVGFLPVCDPGGKVLGVLTDRDLALRLIAEGKSFSTKAAEVMTREVVACRPEDDIERAEALLREHHKSRIMCLDEQGKLVGVISLSDLAQADQKNIGETLRQVSEREAPPMH